MRVVALISGGKDSCYNMMQCMADHHEIVALANLKPKDQDELDSYMYQTVGHHAIDLYAEAMDLPLFRRTIEGSSKLTVNSYLPTEGDEVEDLYELLKEIKEKVKVDAVSCGAILSNYQRLRVENVCSRLGLTSLAYLWQRDQSELLQEMLSASLEAIIIKTACLGLDPKEHLGRSLKDIQPHLLDMNKKYGLNVCGEGGEYETFVIDCPIFKKRLLIDEGSVEKVISQNDSMVGYLNLKKVSLQSKSSQVTDNSVSLVYDSKRTIEEIDALSREANISIDDVVKEVDKEAMKNKQENLIGFSGDKVLFSERPEIGMAFISSVIAFHHEDVTLVQSSKKAMNNLQECVKEKGYKLEDVVSVNLWVNNMSVFAEVNNVYKTYFAHKPPIRACVQAPLPKNVHWQLDCILTKENPNNRTNLHVQGISHWAPANIGPYSQANTTNGYDFYAGQIAMVPGTLDIIPGGITNQCHLAARNAFRAIRVHSKNKPNLVIIYVTALENVVLAENVWRYHFDRTYSAPGIQTKESVDDCHMISCVLPVLPKNALIEYQAIRIDGGEESLSLKADFKRNELYKLDYETRELCRKDESIPFYEVFVSCEHPLSLVGKESELVKDVINFPNLSRILYERPLKIFFNQSLFQYDRISSALESNGFTGAISLIPVNYVKKENGLFNLFVL
ncbi:DgyrCDS11574 [Dimorphilus gyrociliatus]|uniref:Diphthine--ammonia ligase n=1 Tax=Dimorphilus gyrociliatus TaxID=2664684 RepID=A0A7I8W3Z9_9ANNE|nr:DgyrCDS11574 [Dimorphilus gyrociliatus]